MTVWTILAIFAICAIIKIVFKFTTYHNGSYTCLVGKTVIVTGSNNGIGFYTALDFAKRGAKVILACRDEIKAEEAKKKIVQNTDNSNVYVELIDMASLASIRNFAKRINSQEDRLDVLVNNAGAIPPVSLTEDGLLMTMQVNCLGPFLLTMLLIGLFKKTPNSRIVNVSSFVAKNTKMNADNLNEPVNSRLSRILVYDYANAKLCLILWTNELAKRLKNTGVTANSLHPGSIFTDILRDYKTVGKIIMTIGNVFFFKTHEEGAQTTIYAAVSKDMRNVTGKYLNNCAIATPPKLALDSKLAEKVWKNSVRLVKLTADEELI